MCAIFGFIARGSSRPSVDVLSRIVRGNIARGPHSFGFAWIDQRGRLHCFKQAGRLSDHLSLLAIARDARMLIGHLRYATHGDPHENINNHPHPTDGGWLVHNGVVHNYAELVSSHRLWTSSDCDSEAIGLLIERSKASTLAKRCAESIEQTDGGLAILGLWARPDELIAARRGNPLHMTDGTDGVYLATLPTGLPGCATSLQDDSVYRFSRPGRGIHFRRLAIRSTAVVAGGLFDEDGNYRGG